MFCFWLENTLEKGQLLRLAAFRSAATDMENNKQMKATLERPTYGRRELTMSKEYCRLCEEFASLHG